MPATFDRDLSRLLVRAACTFVRAGKGSHQIWQSPITGRRFPVPVGIVSRHTANGVLEQAGMPKAF
jgi:predicted RNA binding protein YcfA (HicA-like mRNA interferase family)